MSTVARFYKQSGQSLQEQFNQHVTTRSRQAANSDIAKLMLAGLAVGAGARGAKGLASVIQGNLSSKPIAQAGPVVTRIPMRLEEEEEDNDDNSQLKQSNWLADEIMGRTARNKYEVPYYLPASVLLTGGALAAGWKGVDSVLDSSRKNKDDARLEEAKQEFERALLPEAEEDKEATSNSLGRSLDALYDSMEKSASIVSGLLGAGGLYAGVTGAGAAYLAYSIAKKKQRRAIFEAAQKRRLSQRAQHRPDEIYAIPHVVKKDSKPADEAEASESSNQDEQQDEKKQDE